MINGERIAGRMPGYKYVVSCFRTAFHNMFLGVTLSECHTEYRVFSKEMLRALPLLKKPDDFAFDNQMTAQAVMFNLRIAENSCPTKYFKDASSINFKRRVKYSLGILGKTAGFLVHEFGWLLAAGFDSTGASVNRRYYSEAAQRT